LCGSGSVGSLSRLHQPFLLPVTFVGWPPELATSHKEHKANKGDLLMLMRKHTILLLLALCFSILSAHAQETNKDVLGALRLRHIGPVGNRVTSVVGIPGQPNIYYAGAASGGIWKTTDGGVHWEPIFDSQPVSCIGALAIAPSNPN